SLRVIAAARALPVQAWGLSRRDLALVRFGRLAAGQSPLALSVDRTAAAPPRRRRLPRQCRCYSLGQIPLRPSGRRGRGPSRSDGRVRWVSAGALESPTSPQPSPPLGAERERSSQCGGFSASLFCCSSLGC